MARVSLKLDAEWKAWRTEDGCWYLHRKGRGPEDAGETRWTFESVAHDVTNGELDARWVAEASAAAAPGAAPPTLPPPSAKAAKQSERMEAVRRLKLRQPRMMEVVAEEAPDDEALVAGGAWYSVALTVCAATEATVRAHVADGVQASAPPAASPLGASAAVAEEWARLLAAAAAPDGVLGSDVRQQLAATSAGAAVVDVAPRLALGEVLEAHASGAPAAVVALAGLLDKFRVTDSAGGVVGGGGGAATAGAGSTSAGSGLPRSASNSAVRFASSSGGGGGGGGGGGAAVGAAAPVPPVSLLGDSSLSVGGARGGEVAVARAIATFRGAYTREKGAELLPAVGDDAWAAKLDATLRGALASRAWRAAFLEAADATDASADEFLAYVLHTMVSAGYHADVAGCRAGSGDTRVLAACLVDAMVRATRERGQGVAPPDAPAAHATALAATLRQVATRPHDALVTLEALRYGVGAVAGVLPGVPGSSAAGGAGGVAGWRRPTDALPLGRLRQEVGYRTLATEAARASELPLAPLRPEFEAAAAGSGGGGVGSGSGVEAGESGDAEAEAAARALVAAAATVRRVALAAFPALRGDLFMEEDGVVALGSAPVPPPVTGDDGGETAASRAGRLTALRLAPPAPPAAVREFLTALASLCRYMVNSAEVAALRAEDANLVAAVAGGEVGEAERLRQVRELRGQGALVARTVAQPDVIAFILHLLFHPGVAVEDAMVPGMAAAAAAEAEAAAGRGGGGGGAGGGSDDDSDAEGGGQRARAAPSHAALSMVCSACAWALWSAGTDTPACSDTDAPAGEPASGVHLRPLGVTESGACWSALTTAVAPPPPPPELGDDIPGDAVWVDTCGNALLSAAQVRALGG